MRKKTISKREGPELRDRIRVMVKCGNGSFESSYLTVTSLQFNGRSIKLFGRPAPNGVDRVFEAEEIVFRCSEDLDRFVRFEVDSYVSKHFRSTVDLSIEGNNSALESVSAPLRKKFFRRLMSHPSIRINSEIFKR